MDTQGLTQVQIKSAIRRREKQIEEERAKIAAPRIRDRELAEFVLDGQVKRVQVLLDEVANLRAALLAAPVADATNWVEEGRLAAIRWERALDRLGGIPKDALRGLPRGAKNAEQRLKFELAYRAEVRRHRATT